MTTTLSPAPAPAPVPAPARPASPLLGEVLTDLATALDDVLLAALQGDAARARAVLRTGRRRRAPGPADDARRASTVAGTLIRHDLAQRVRNPEDRRAYLMTPTPAGRRALTAAHRRLAAADAELGGPRGEDDARELHALLLRLLRPHLAGAGAEPPGRLLASLSFLLTRTHALHHRVVAEAVAPLDLEPRDLGALTALHALGPVPQHELARALGVSGAHLVQIADDLERVGAVERRRSPEDRRTQVLHPLPASARLLAAAHAAARGASEPWSSALPPRSRQRLRRLLVQLVTG